MKPRMKKWVVAARIVVLLAVILGLAVAIGKAEEQWSALGEDAPSLLDLRLGPLTWAAVFYAISLLPPILVLRGWLRVLGEDVSLPYAACSQLIGHLGKYVPGKAMVVVIRAGILRDGGVNLKKASIAVFLETFLMIAVGAVVGAVVLLWLPVPSWILVAAIFGAILAVFPTLPPVLSIVASKLTGERVVLGRDAWVAGFKAWGWMLISWFCVGSSFAAIAVSTASNDPSFSINDSLFKIWIVATAAISIAMVLGFASLLPGGAGVRELVLTLVLGLVTSPIHALIAAIVARLVFLAVECLMALGGWAVLTYCKKIRKAPEKQPSGLDSKPPSG